MFQKPKKQKKKTRNILIKKKLFHNKWDDCVLMSNSSLHMNHKENIY